MNRITKAVVAIALSTGLVLSGFGLTTLGGGATTNGGATGCCRQIA